MKKPKFQLKIDRNNRCKVYLNKKWQKDIVQLSFYGIPQAYSVTVSKYARDSRGQLIVEGEGNNIHLKMNVKSYYIGRKK